jgi:adenylate kinase
MKILISGTPATGKTTISKILAKELNYKYISINDFAKTNNLIIGQDKTRDSFIIDQNKLSKQIEKINENIILDGHIAHFCKGNLTIILRLKPKELKKRLKKRNWNQNKINENIDAELIGICSHQTKNKTTTIEIDTTNLNKIKLLKIIKNIITNHKLNKTELNKKYKIGSINWLNNIKNIE